MRALLPVMATGVALLAGRAGAATLQVALNHSVRLPVSGPAASVVVGSPSVVDVAVVDSRTVFVSGRSAGETDVTVVDPLGRVVFRGDVAVTGGSSVNVFRGAARSQAVCAPYCRTLANDDTGAAAEATVGGLAASPAVSPLAAVASTAGGGLAASTSQGVAAMGQAFSPR